MSRRPLDGVRVLDLSRLLPGPFLTMALADLGADVVKIEEPQGGDYLRLIPPTKAGMSGRFLAINRGKRSLSLDLKAAGRDALLRMVERADVVVESFRPGVMARLGLDAAALRARNPRLVVCSLSGYGQDGPYAGRAGHDLDYLALAGVLAMGGCGDGGAPALPGVQIADLAGGALWGLAAVLAALYGRERSGEGAHLDISMTEGALALLAAELGNLDAGARGATRGATTLTGGAAGYAIYRCADGRHLAVGALEPRFWLAFNAAIGRPADAAEIAAGPARQAEIRAEVAALIARRSRDEWAVLLAASDCCAEPVLELDELIAHPLHRARGVFFAIEASDAGEVLQVRTPLGAPARPRLAPRHGADDGEVLAEYGFTPAEIEAVLRTSASPAPG